MSVSEWLRHLQKGRRAWGVIGHHELPVIYGNKEQAEEDRDYGERLALFKITEITSLV